jgi:hypothetical protein
LKLLSSWVPTVVIESDCKEYVQAGNSVRFCPWQIQSMVLEFLDAMGNLHCWSLHWVRRDANKAFHALAQWSLHNLSWGPLNFCNGPRPLFPYVIWTFKVFVFNEYFPLIDKKKKIPKVMPLTTHYLLSLNNPFFV